MNIRYLTVFWILWFLTFSTRTALSPLLPVIEEELHLSHALSGGLYLALSVGYTISLLLSGALAPRIGYKRLILIQFVFMAAVLACPWFAGEYRVLVGIFFLVGAGGGLYLPSAIPLLTRIYEVRRWGRVLALHDTAASISIMAIPFLATLILHLMNWRGFFLVLSISCVLAATLFSVVVPDAPPEPGEERGSMRQILCRSEFWIMVILWTVASTASMGLYGITPLFLVTEKGIPLETANSLFGLSRIGGVFATVIAGFLADRFGVRPVLVLVFLITGVSTVGIAVAPSFLILVIMLFIQAALSNGFFPVGMVALSKVSRTGERSLFTGAVISGGTIAGLGLAPLCLGAAADMWSFQAGILVTGLMIMVSAFIALLIRDM
jgi:MFS transporter, NNP family, nitrate/nitrite transporter